MEHKEFKEASENYSRFLSALVNASASYIPQAKECLEGDNPLPDGATSRESAADLVLSGISERIDDVMSSFDKIQRSINMENRYKPYFDLPRR